jgi:hypothetical protein
LSQRRHVRLLILSSHTSGFTDIHPKLDFSHLRAKGVGYALVTNLG